MTACSATSLTQPLAKEWFSQRGGLSTDVGRGFVEGPTAGGCSPPTDFALVSAACRERPVGSGEYHERVAKKLQMIDLFAGCGGMTAGFVRHGFEPALSVEWNLHAAATYAANFGEQHTSWGDIDDALNGDIPAADIVIGGPPCQGFSNLGSRDVNARGTNCGSVICRSLSARARRSSSSRMSIGSGAALSFSYSSTKLVMG